MNKTPVWKGLRGTIVPRSCAGIMGIVNLTPMADVTTALKMAWPTQDSFFSTGPISLIWAGNPPVPDPPRSILPRKPAGSCPSLTDSRP